ncbi:MAG: YbeD family protein [Chloroflexota bacterium]
MSSAAPIQYPIQIALRVMGRSTPGFPALVIEQIRLHVPEVDPQAVSLRPSRDGNFISVVVPLMLTSQEQFDAVYRQLSSNDQILMVL